MKVIAVFSGKGGVGKTTVSSLLALALAKNHKVTLFDMDIQTPSIPVMFGAETKIKNLDFVSTGYKAKGAITLTGGMAKKTLRDLATKVTDLNPDICIIDMPPGTNDVHMQVCSSLKPSSAILVVQPNKLSEEDALRAIQLFMAANIPIAGVIKNMTGDVFGQSEDIDIMGLHTLAVLPLNKQLANMGSAGKLHMITDNPLSGICEDIYNKAGNVNWLNSKAFIEGGIDGEILKRNCEHIPRTFICLNSWEVIREHLMGPESMVGSPDRFLMENTTEKIRQMLEGLDDQNTGMFMVTKAPSTQIVLFPGEIGIASLAPPNPSYYGVPRVLYHTNEGDVTLFSHEIKPMSSDELISFQNENTLTTIPGSSTPRYLPTPEVMQELEDTFGERIGVSPDWRDSYRKLGIIK